jgi:hypothetical protein
MSYLSFDMLCKLSVTNVLLFLKGNYAASILLAYFSYFKEQK